MDPDNSGFQISDVVISRQGRDQGEWFYVIGQEEGFLLLANGRNRTLEAPQKEEAKARRESTSI